MYNQQKYLYNRSNKSKDWLPKYRHGASKTVFLLKPRQLTASAEDFPECTDDRDKSYGAARPGYIYSKISSHGLSRKPRYDHLNTQELPRYRRRAELTKSQYEPESINDSISKGPNKSYSDYLRSKDKCTMEHQSGKEHQSVSHERGRTVIIDENVGLINKATEKKYRDDEYYMSKDLQKIKLYAEENSEPYTAFKGKNGMTKQMESRYLTDVEHRLYNAINIFVFKNGVENQSPALIHIEPHQKSTMHGIMSVIQERIRFPIGYPKYLYTVGGTKLIYAYQLKNHGEYVVATNLHKKFQPLQYGRMKTPLMMMGKQSKHIRNLIQKFEEDCCRDNYNENMMNHLEDGIPYPDIERDHRLNESNRLSNKNINNDVAAKEESDATRIRAIQKLIKDQEKQQQESTRKTFHDVGTTTNADSKFTDNICGHYSTQNVNNSTDHFSQKSKYSEEKEANNENDGKAHGCSCCNCKCGLDKLDKTVDCENTRSGITKDEQNIYRALFELEPGFLPNKIESHCCSCKANCESKRSTSLYEGFQNAGCGSERNELFSKQDCMRSKANLFRKKRCDYSASVNKFANKKKGQFREDECKGPFSSTDLLAQCNMPSNHSQNPINSQLKQDILYNNTSGQGIGKLNVLPCFGYPPPQQPAYIIQPLQLPNPNQPSKIAIGQSGRIGITDPWSQQVFLQNPNIQNIPAPQIMQIVPPQNFQIASSGYSSVPGVQISGNNDNNMAQFYTISSSGGLI